MADKPASAGTSGRAGGTVPPQLHHEAPPVREVPRHRRKVPVLGSWLVYLIVLACVAAGLFITWQGGAARGTGLVGCSLLGAAVARLVLPPHYAGPLSSRRKASDVLAFAALGAGVLGVALMLP